MLGGMEAENYEKSGRKRQEAVEIATASTYRLGATATSTKTNEALVGTPLHV